MMIDAAGNSGVFPSIRAGLQIDPAAEARKIEPLVRTEVARLRARRVVLGLSGGRGYPLIALIPRISAISGYRFLPGRTGKLAR